jgi:hypothetical protein
VTIEDITHQRERACPRHAAEALNRLVGGRVIWDDTHGINEHEATTLRLAEERSQLARTDTSISTAAALPALLS